MVCGVESITQSALFSLIYTFSLEAKVLQFACERNGVRSICINRLYIRTHYGVHDHARECRVQTGLLSSSFRTWTIVLDVGFSNGVIIYFIFHRMYYARF